MNFRWKNYSGHIRVTKYATDGSPAWLFEDTEPIATLTVCLDTPPPAGCIYVKDYSENEGVLAALVEHGYVEDTGQRVQSGYVQIPVARVVGTSSTRKEISSLSHSSWV